MILKPIAERRELVGALPKIRTWNWSFVDSGDIHFTKRAM